jgi:4-hydroxy-tetrahydrodipicolinate synthase
MKAAPRSGIHVALWIPLGNDGKVARESLARHLDWLKLCGLHGVLALGSTGEFARMPLDQREHVLETVVELAHPMPVIANISSILLEEAVALGQRAHRLGAVGAALMPPPFFPLAQEDILEFFLRTAERVSLPFYLYNYPEVTGNRIGLEVVSSFADRAPMAGIKQSGSELSYHDDLIRLGREKNFSVFTAADTLLAEFMDRGAAGCLGGVPNFLPEYLLTVYHACRARRTAEVAEISTRLRKIGELLDSLRLPLNVRSGMAARGFNPGLLKGVYSASTLATLEKTTARLRETFAEWGLPCFSHG